MSYAAYAPRIEEAARKPALWRLLAGLVLAGLLTLATSQALVLTAVTVGGREFAGHLIAGTSPAGLLVLLLAMGTLAIGALIAARALHGRGPASVIGPYGPALRQGAKVLAALFALQALMLGLASWGTEETLAPNLPLGIWLTLLPLGLVGVLVQTGAEEILFRGYLQSQLAARFRSPLLWLLPQAALFALGHYAVGTFGSNALGVALWAGLFGLLAGDLTARTGTLGPAIALHFANNVMVILLVSMEGILSGLSLFTFPFSPQDEAAVARALPLDFAGLLVGWLAARVVLRV